MKDEIDPVLRLSAFLPYRLSVLSNLVSRAIADSYEQQFNLTLPEWRVMAVLGETPDLSANEVAARTAMDKVAVSRAVKRLQTAGRLVRTVYPQDRRQSVLSLSEEGWVIYRQIVPLALKHEATILSMLSESEALKLRSVLARLTRNLSADLD